MTDPASPKRPGLRLVERAKTGPAERVRRRIRNMPRPDGMLQCNRCGGRSTVTEVAGAFVRNGRKQGGTVLAKDQCANCWRQGIYSPMIPLLKGVGDGPPRP